MQLPGIIAGFVGICGAVVMLSGKEIAVPAFDLGPLGGIGQMNQTGDGTSAENGVGTDFRGKSYRGTATLSSGKDVVDFAKLVSGLKTDAGMAVPAELRRLPVPEACSFTAPGMDALVASVNLEHTRRGGPVALLDRGVLVRSALDWLRRYKSSNYRLKLDGDGSSSGQMTVGMVDVLVTERSKPVYLVLQTDSAAMWNVTVSPGVQIERIVVLGGGPVAIADPGKDIPVEVIGAMHSLCGVAPNRPVTEDWDIVRNERELGVEYDHAEFDEPYGEYRNWYEKATGRSFEDGLLTAQDAGYILVGPVPTPDAPLPSWASLEGRTILLSGSDHQGVIATEAEFADRANALRNELILAAIGGEPARLAPVVEERTQ